MTQRICEIWHTMCFVYKPLHTQLTKLIMRLMNYTKDNDEANNLLLPNYIYNHYNNMTNMINALVVIIMIAVTAETIIGTIIILTTTLGMTMTRTMRVTATMTMRTTIK